VLRTGLSRKSLDLPTIYEIMNLISRFCCFSILWGNKITVVLCGIYLKPILHFTFPTLQAVSFIHLVVFYLKNTGGPNFFFLVAHRMAPEL
jgi:hypothetical protein